MQEFSNALRKHIVWLFLIGINSFIFSQETFPYKKTYLHYTGDGYVCSHLDNHDDFLAQNIPLGYAGKPIRSYVQPPQETISGKTAATFEITYDGFTAEAQAAFQFAADIWASLLVSNVPIKVDAKWTALGENVLGAATPSTFYRDFGSGTSNSWYPSALADKIANQNLTNTDDPDGLDIEAEFSNEFDNWYFGTDGNPPQGRIDFVTVVLHELGHGLGIVGSLALDEGANTGSWGAGSGFPFIFDRFIKNGNGQALTSTGNFNNPSSELGNQLISDNLFFDGEEARGAHNGANPKLYAPTSWEEGSSISHLDEDTFPPGNANSLMTPQVATGEAIHSPGPVVFGMFQDMGWNINSDGVVPYLSIFQNPALGGVLHFAVNVENFSGPMPNLTVNGSSVTLAANGNGGWYGSFEVGAGGDVEVRLVAGTGILTRNFSVNR